jgi:hypothetical protein
MWGVLAKNPNIHPKETKERPISRSGGLTSLDPYLILSPCPTGLFYFAFGAGLSVILIEGAPL